MDSLLVTRLTLRAGKGIDVSLSMESFNCGARCCFHSICQLCRAWEPLPAARDIRLKIACTQLPSLAWSYLGISCVRCFSSQRCSSWPGKATSEPAAASRVARPPWPPQHAGLAAAPDLDEMSDPVVQSSLFPGEAADRATGIGKPAGYSRLLQQWLVAPAVFYFYLTYLGHLRKAPHLCRFRATIPVTEVSTARFFTPISRRIETDQFGLYCSCYVNHRFMSITRPLAPSAVRCRGRGSSSERSLRQVVWISRPRGREMSA